MAIDEAILQAVEAGKAPPTLRLYAWNPPCLSLGYAQPLEDVDLDRLNANGWEVVRRPTGGRAILHTDELTYAVIAPESEPRVAGSILESYQRLASALLNGLHHLRANAISHENHAPTQNMVKGPICFEVPSQWEITLDNKKLIGSAQARRKTGMLQHGTLPLYGNLGRIVEALKFPDETARQEAARQLLSRATTLEQSMGRQVSWEQAAQAMQEGFAETLNIRFEPGNLSGEEEENFERLLPRYLDPARSTRPTNA